MVEKLESEQIEKKAKGFLFVILFLNSFRYIEVSMIDIGLPNFVLSLAGTLSAYGLVVGIFALSQSIFQVPIAAASDRIGRKPMIILCIFIYIIGTFLCYLSENIWQLILFRAIQGIGAYSSVIQAMIGDYFRKEHGKGMALYLFTITIGFFIGFIVGGFIFFYLGSRTIFLIVGILAIISIIFVAIFLKDPRKSRDFEGNISDLRGKIKFSDLKIILKKSQFKLILFINSIRWFLFFGIYAYIIWMLAIYYDLAHTETIIILIIIVLLYSISILLGGYLADHKKFGTKKTMLLGQIFVITFGFILFFISGLFIFIIVSIFVSSGFALVEIAGNAYLSRLLEETDPSLKSSGFGFNNALGFFFSGMGPIFITIIGEIYIFLPYFIVSMIIGIIFLITVKFIKK